MIKMNTESLNENITSEVIDYCNNVIGATVLGVHSFKAPWQQDEQAEINVTIPVRTFYDKVVEPYYYNEIRKCIHTPITMHGDNPGDLTAKQILADIAGGTVNDTTKQLTTRLIFGNKRNPGGGLAKKLNCKSDFIAKIETYNNRVVIVRFTDGTYTKSVCAKDDIFDIDTGITICLFKKHLGVNGNKEFNDLIRRAHKIIDIQEKEAKKEDEIKAKNKQKLEKLKKNREAKKLKEREERIDIIAEAIRKGSATK